MAPTPVLRKRKGEQEPYKKKLTMSASLADANESTTAAVEAVLPKLDGCGCIFSSKEDQTPASLGPKAFWLTAVLGCTRCAWSNIGLQVI